MFHESIQVYFNGMALTTPPSIFSKREREIKKKLQMGGGGQHDVMEYILKGCLEELKWLCNCNKIFKNVIIAIYCEPCVLFFNIDFSKYGKFIADIFQKQII